MKSMLTGLEDTLSFLRAFHEPAMASIQGMPVEDPLVPGALRKVYGIFGDPQTSFGPINGQDSLLGPSDLRRVGDYVHFLDESQGCWSCAYRVDGGDDPAVFLFEEDEPVKQSDSLGEFLVTVLLQESVISAPHGIHQENGSSAGDVLMEPVNPLWGGAIYSRPNPTHWFYWSEASKILIMRFGGDYAPWLWMGAYEDHWERVIRECDEGFIVSSPSEEERRIGSLRPEEPEGKRFPKWLRWLE